jgi:hypothetical protein
LKPTYSLDSFDLSRQLSEKMNPTAYLWIDKQDEYGGRDGVGRLARNEKNQPFIVETRARANNQSYG